MSRYDLTDFEWRAIEPLLPNKPRGVSRVDDRRMLNAIFWVLRSGAMIERVFSKLKHSFPALQISLEMPSNFPASRRIT